MGQGNEEERGYLAGVTRVHAGWDHRVHAGWNHRVHAGWRHLEGIVIEGFLWGAGPAHTENGQHEESHLQGDIGRIQGGAHAE